VRFLFIYLSTSHIPNQQSEICQSNLPVAIQGNHYILLSKAELAPTGVVIVSAVNFFLVPYALCLAPFINLQSKISQASWA
jgi:hypothetical protein